MAYPYLFQHLTARKDIKSERFAGVLFCVVLLFFMAFRGETVGVDTQYYCTAYEQFRAISWRELFSASLYGSETSSSFTFNFEPGYRLLNKLLSCFSSTPQTIIIASSAIIIFLLYQVVKQDSPMILLSLWLYVTLGVYQTEMNVSRNAIAILISYMGLRWIQEKKPGRYVLCIAAAAMFHQSALAFLPLYWIVNHIHLSRAKMLVFVSAFMLCGLNFTAIAQFLQETLPYRYARYFEAGDYSAASILVGVFSAVLFLIVWIFMKREEREQSLETLRVGNWMFTLDLCFFGLNLGVEIGARAAALFGPYVICLIPQMLECMDDKSRKKRATVLIVAISFLQYAARLTINNIGGTMPYQFFWNI